MRKSRQLFLLLLAALAAASCIYDYNPQIDGEGGYMIVEGNLVIGEISSIRTNWSWSLVDTTQGNERREVLGTNRMHVEASDGTRYENTYTAQGGYFGSFDLREADPALEYRLVIENVRGTYTSGWAAPTSPGVIDSLSYRISPDGETMGILVASHGGQTGESYYRWTVDETWEYHAQVQALYKYLPESGEVVPTTEEDESHYTCWSSGRRPEIMTGSSEGLLEDRLADHQLYTLTKHDARISFLYCAEVRQMRLPEEAYRYWQVMERNARDVGGLFSPEPSELRGNVVNLDNPEELVLGYVGVMTVASRRLFVDNSQARFYRSLGGALPPIDTLSSPDEWKLAYYGGKLPVVDVWSEEPFLRFLGYEWWPARCVDCRVGGGSINKPAFWPR